MREIRKDKLPVSKEVSDRNEIYPIKLLYLCTAKYVNQT